MNDITDTLTADQKRILAADPEHLTDDEYQQREALQRDLPWDTTADWQRAGLIASDDEPARDSRHLTPDLPSRKARVTTAPVWGTRIAADVPAAPFARVEPVETWPPTDHNGQPFRYMDGGEPERCPNTYRSLQCARTAGHDRDGWECIDLTRVAGWRAYADRLRETAQHYLNASNAPGMSDGKASRREAAGYLRDEALRLLKEANGWNAQADTDEARSL